MGWYRRSSTFILNAFRRNNSQITLPRKPIQESISRTNLLTSFTKFSHPIFRNSAFQNGFKQNHLKSSFLDRAKRFYHLKPGGFFYHFKPGGFEEWVQNPRNRCAVFLAFCEVVIAIYCGNLETVPYTKRSHFVIFSSDFEEILGDVLLHMLKIKYGGKILPASHPESIRLQRVLQDIIEALQKGLRKEQVWGDIRYSPENVGSHNEEDMILDDKWVQRSRKKGQEKGKESQIGHLEGLKWEVIVVDEPVINARCLPGGKIVVFTGLLNRFKADAEIATILGHEVGHAVGRHSVEGVSKWFWLPIFLPVCCQNVTLIVLSMMSVLLLLFRDRRRMEMEADYIGLLLIASTGYDPRVAPQVHKKLRRVIESDWALQNYLRNCLATHPSRKVRAQALSQAKVMEEALTIYREVQAERGIEGFI